MRTLITLALGLGLAGSASAEHDAQLEAELQARLPDHAILTGEIGVGLQLASSGHGGSPIGTLDVTAAHPLWVRLRGRYIPGSVFVDTLVAYSARHRRGPDRDTETLTETVGETSAAYIRRTSVYERATIARRDIVLAGGLKHEWNREDDAFRPHVLMAGAQAHFVTTEGVHDYVELYALFNLDTGRPGIQAIWHNSTSFLPTIFGRRLYVGMELALVPTAMGTAYYVGLVDLGISFEL